MKPILGLPTLELELRDDEGCTLLLSGCKSSLGADASIETSVNLELFDNTDKNAPFSDPEAVTPFEYLLSRSADPMARDKWGRNALHLLFRARDYNCTMRGGKEIPPRIANSVQYLMKIAPELIQQKTHEGLTPFHIALLRLKKYNYLSPFTKVAQLADSVMDLIYHDADTDITFPDAGGPYSGESVLNFLAKDLVYGPWAKERRGILRYLLHLGAIPFGENNEGKTPRQVFEEDFTAGETEPKGGHWRKGGLLSKQVMGMGEGRGDIDEIFSTSLECYLECASESGLDNIQWRI